MSEESFVMHSAPTLAGIKTGSLFTVKFHQDESVVKIVRNLNIILAPKGIRVIPLRRCDDRILIYVYRPNNLKDDFYNKKLLKLLNDLEYPIDNLNKCIVRLKERINQCDSFPHEVGLFLGYPPEDVQGFIENKAQNYKLKGMWKVYGDESEAQKRFKRYERCTRDYCLRIAQGYTIDNLATSQKSE